MPLYSYRCTKCGNELNDVLVKLSDKTERICPICGMNMDKKVDIFGYVLKDGGVGWSSDGYSRRGGRK